MKNIIKILAFFLFIVILGSTLYVFDLPPFNSKTQQPTTTNSVSVQNEEQNLPDFLQEKKVSRNQTYEEHVNRAELLEQNNFPTLAIAEYQSANKIDPTNTEPLFRIGRIYLRINEFKKAQVVFESALKISPDDTNTKVYLGRAYLGEREIAKAKDIFSSVTAETQESKYYQAITAAYFGDYDKSKKLLNGVISLNNNDILSKKANNFLNAFNEYNFNTEGTPIHLKTLLARSYNQTGEYQIAIPLLFDVIKEKKDYRDAWILLGYAYLNINKYQDAIDALEEAKKLDPQNNQTLFFLGLSYYSMNDYKQAVTYLEQAKSNGYEPKIQVDQKLAEVYLLLNQYQKSASYYEEAISFNDEDVNYYVRPIWIYIEKMNQPEKALALAQQAINKHSKEAMSYNLMGWTLLNNQKIDEAESNLKKAMALNPNLDATYLNYGLLMEKKGNHKEALNFYKKANQLGKNNGIANVAAQNYNQLIKQTKNSQNIMANSLTN